MGQCPACKGWNTFVEEPAGPVKISGKMPDKAGEPVYLSSVSSGEESRMSTGIEEFDRVLGGGIVAGSLVLVGGDPGIGKSTLMLQMCRCLSEQGCRTLYVSGEESLVQIRMRADRIGEFKNDLWMLCETNLDIIRDTIQKYRPEVVIIDSIQTMYREDISSGAGSVSQVREATNMLMQLAKKENTAVFIIGHVTKEGVVAGPRVLEHMVDTVLYFEGDRHASYRLLRSVKNRFGSTNEIGVFEMTGEGLAEVENPSEYMIEGRSEGASGTAVTCAMEGTRPIMLEVQALVCRTNFQIPRRTAAGTDYNRINLLMAVLEKRLGLKTASCDAYINLAGGMKLNEPAIDLAIAAAIISSYKNVPVREDTVIFGEIGLTGEVRSVSQAPVRVKEAKRLGFKTVCLPAGNMKNVERDTSVDLVGIGNVKDIYDFILQI